MDEIRISKIANLIVAQGDTIKVGDDANKVALFLDNNPNPADKDFHKWAEGKGFDVDVMESAAYELATLFSSFLLYGRSNEKKVYAQDVDSNELGMGIKVEMEHTKDKSIAERIALDHLAEAPADTPLKYYTGLKLLETIIERISKMDKKVASEKIAEFKHFVDGLGF